MNKIREMIKKYATAEWCRDDYMAQECIIWENFYDMEKELKEMLIQYTDELKEYTHEFHVILGDDERESIEFVEIFLI